MMMRLFAAAVSYIVYAWSVAAYGWLYLAVPQTTDQFGNATYDPNLLAYFGVGYILSSVFMVLSPYFGIAALEGATSIWRRAVALIERHISFPFLSAVLLIYARGYLPLVGAASSGTLLGYNPEVGGIMAIYTSLVIVASIMVLLAKRSASASGAATMPQPPVAPMDTPSPG